MTEKPENKNDAFVDGSTTFAGISQLSRKIGKYEIINEIGKGSMGTVYSARDPFTDNYVAIKVAHSNITEEENGERYRKLFFNEARAAGLLDHPSILKTYDADMEGNLCYLVMEYIENATTLESFCKADTLLGLREVVGLIYKAARALDYAHRQGIIHRDIKPSNILFTQNRDMKLADFSVAMINRADVKSTQLYGFVGSPIYMSPEQINEKDLGCNSDIFSLGVVMYELLTGQHPFKADTLSSIHLRITEEKPLPLSTYRNDISDEFEYILKRMLMKNPEKRYAMGLDLAADLAVLFEDLDAVDNEDDLRKKFYTIKDLGFFKTFTDADLWELIRACNWEKYKTGEGIVVEGELDDSFYIILSGVVEVKKEEQHIGKLQAGDCFGEMGYLSKTKRTATVNAITDVSVIEVNADTLDRARESTQLRFLKVFVKTIVERLSLTTSAFTQLKQI